MSLPINGCNRGLANSRFDGYPTDSPLVTFALQPPTADAPHPMSGPSPQSAPSARKPPHYTTSAVASSLGHELQHREISSWPVRSPTRSKSKTSCQYRQEVDPRKSRRRAPPDAGFERFATRTPVETRRFALADA